MTSNRALYFLVDNVLEIILGAGFCLTLGLTVSSYYRGFDSVGMMCVLLAFQAAFGILGIKSDREHKAKWS